MNPNVRNGGKIISLDAIHQMAYVHESVHGKYPVSSNYDNTHAKQVIA
jgi:hypothetical protein